MLSWPRPSDENLIKLRVPGPPKVKIKRGPGDEPMLLWLWYPLTSHLLSHWTLELHCQQKFELRTTLTLCPVCQRGWHHYSCMAVPRWHSCIAHPGGRWGGGVAFYRRLLSHDHTLVLNKWLLNNEQCSNVQKPILWWALFLVAYYSWVFSSV